VQRDGGASLITGKLLSAKHALFEHANTSIVTWFQNHPILSTSPTGIKVKPCQLPIQRILQDHPPRLRLALSIVWKDCKL